MKKIIMLLSLMAVSLVAHAQSPTGGSSDLAAKMDLYAGDYNSYEGWNAKVERIDQERIKVSTSEGNSAIYNCVSSKVFGFECQQELKADVTCDKVTASFVGGFKLLLVNGCQKRAYYFFKSF